MGEGRCNGEEELHREGSSTVYSPAMSRLDLVRYARGLGSRGGEVEGLLRKNRGEK